MNAEWIKSTTARRVLAHWIDPRPAWLWSFDGTKLIWHNGAAGLFRGKTKKGGVRPVDEVVPIKGQVARLIRLGMIGRSSLSRVQFLSGGKPTATTCSCTPLLLPDGALSLLLVGVDPIDRALFAELEADGPAAPVALSLPSGARLDLHEIEAPADLARSDTPPTAAAVDLGAVLGSGRVADEPADEPLLPLDLAPVPHAPPPPAASEWVEMAAPEGLTSLFDRLADDADLYAPLTPADDAFLPPVAQEDSWPPPAKTPAAEPSISTALWSVTGRGLRSAPVAAEVAEAPAEQSADAVAADAVAAGPVPGALEEKAATQENFEELGRILTDSVAAPDDEPSAFVEPEEAEEAEEAPGGTTRIARAIQYFRGQLRQSPPGSGARDGAGPRENMAAAASEGVVSLNTEILVLNRLTLPILIFRDQQILFANRALLDLLGFDSIEGLRARGLGAVFPDDGASPVGDLVRRDGQRLAVAARLQSVGWYGRPALMLSASLAEAANGHEGAVRDFAESLAELRREGFFLADRAGRIVRATPPTSALLGVAAGDIAGKPLGGLVGRSDSEAVRVFLETPARFAETQRPRLRVIGARGRVELLLFAEGQVGIVSGYFGFVRPLEQAPAPQVSMRDFDPAMLGRLSRGIRGPLNTIVGFADLIGSAENGAPARERAAEYAQDIRTAGLEIAALADELDEFNRLHEGRAAPHAAQVDLSVMLDSCMTRVRRQAGAARVLVRSAISTRLPRVRADAPSLMQALLNLLASAIEHTPEGGSVILSAQRDGEGAIAISLRDGALNAVDLREDFIVFRDGVDKTGEALVPVRSSVGLVLTRSLLAANACTLSIDPTASTGTLFSLLIPAEAVIAD